ncbi:MAG: class II fumarate hydratase [Alphaproteobacteria bacterium]|tara:strand:+ start:183 stop:1574 length:1392 start_codon:yes stop_codon:yes gene_type:complete
MTKYRIEKDSIGTIKVSKEKIWGAQTQRSLENFEIGNEKIPLELIRAFAVQKKASAISNVAIGKLEKIIGEKIIDACDKIINGELDNEFPLSVWQTGSGTQTNMNLNEVIANYSNKSLGEELGKYKRIHPNDHCNMGQSSNDSFPTAMHISIVLETNKNLLKKIDYFIQNLQKKEKEFRNIIKVGRTHLQDATPISVGQEFGTYVSQIKNAQKRIKDSLKELMELAQGGTAVGTGLNTSKKFISGFIKAVQMITGLPFRESQNKFESLSSHEPILNFSGALNTLIVACYKICNDIRFLGSGPRSGIGELVLPSNEPGSSIMPGKTNPTQCESMAQVCIYLLGLQSSISIACSQGHFQLNANKTFLIFATLKTIALLSDSIRSFTNNCLKNIKANKKRIDYNLDNSLMLVTALNPRLGYDKSAEIAKKAFKDGITLKQSAVKLGYLTEKEFDLIIDPKKMTKIS